MASKSQIELSVYYPTTFLLSSTKFPPQIPRVEVEDLRKHREVTSRSTFLLTSSLVSTHFLGAIHRTSLLSR